MSPADPTPPTELEELALERLTKVLGAGTGHRVYEEALRAAGITSLRTPDDLYAVAKVLANRGGFEGAVGGFLRVRAVLRGASRT